MGRVTATVLFTDLVGSTELRGRLAHEAGVIVFAGRCDEDLGVPYQPIVEALRHFVDHRPATEGDGRLGRYAGAAERGAGGIERQAVALNGESA